LHNKEHPGRETTPGCKGLNNRLLPDEGWGAGGTSGAPLWATNKKYGARFKAPHPRICGWHCRRTQKRPENAMISTAIGGHSLRQNKRVFRQFLEDLRSYLQMSLRYGVRWSRTRLTGPKRGPVGVWPRRRKAAARKINK
jgi:hypothetical protein